MKTINPQHFLFKSELSECMKFKHISMFNYNLQLKLVCVAFIILLQGAQNNSDIICWYFKIKVTNKVYVMSQKITILLESNFVHWWAIL